MQYSNVSYSSYTRNHLCHKVWSSCEQSYYLTGIERYDDRGIIPRVISHLFKSFKDGKNGVTYSCFVSYLEIYNQSGYDLLMDHDGKGRETPKVTMLEDEYGNFHFKNLSMHMVSCEEDALNLLFLGDTNRAIAATEMNENSTRSHW